VKRMQNGKRNKKIEKKKKSLNFLAIYFELFEFEFGFEFGLRSITDCDIRCRSIISTKRVAPMVRW
jgi:hypothetical protein